MVVVLIYDLAATAMSRTIGGKSLSVTFPEVFFELPPEVDSGCEEDPSLETEQLLEEVADDLPARTLS